MDVSGCSSFEQQEYREQRDLAIKLAAKGLSYQVIAQRCACIGRPVSATTVGVWVRRAGQRPKRKQGVTVERSDGARYVNMKMAAEDAGCAPATMRRHLRNGTPIGDYTYKVVESV